MTGILIYLFILLFGLSCVVLRDKTSLLKGKSFLKFNLIFLGVVSLAIVITDQLERNLITVYLLLVLCGFSLVIRKKWLLLNDKPMTTSLIIEDCFSKMLMPFQKSKEGYTIKTSEDDKLLLIIVALWPKSAIISFKEDVHHKKGDVLKNFLVKRFTSIFPKLIIKLK